MVEQNSWRSILRKIAIISNHKGISGSPVNLLDFTDYLVNRLFDVKFWCYNRWYLKDIIDDSCRKYRTGEVVQFNNNVIIQSRKNVVTDFVTLVTLDPAISCRKLIVFDNAELSYHLNGITNFFYPKDIGDIRKFLDKHHFSDVMFLMPKINYYKFKDKYPDIPATIFHKKINIQALLTVPFSDNKRWFYRGERDNNEPQAILDYQDRSTVVDRLKDKNILNMFKYHGYIYYRRKDRSMFEQFGRTLFEFLILGKDIHYLDHPNDVDDGLKEYWNHYGKGDKEIVRKMMSEDYDYRPWEN